MVAAEVTNDGIDESTPSMERRSHSDLTGLLVRRSRQEGCVGEDASRTGMRGNLSGLLRRDGSGSGEI